MVNKTVRERTIIDIEKFDVNIKQLTVTAINEKVITKAKRYYSDTKYFLDSGDEVTAFGSIVYAHGLIDALRLIEGII